MRVSPNDPILGVEHDCATVTAILLLGKVFGEVVLGVVAMELVEDIDGRGAERGLDLGVPYDRTWSCY